MAETKVRDYEKEYLVSQCQWVKMKCRELEALLELETESIACNKTWALTSIETSIDSLKELKEYFEKL